MLEKSQRILKLCLTNFYLRQSFKAAVYLCYFSTSEAGGGVIGQHSSLDVAKAVYDILYPELLKNNIYLAAQCCEHLNRAVIVEGDLAEKLGLEVVNAVPQLHARCFRCNGLQYL